MTDDAVDAEIETLAKQNQLGSGEEFLAALEKQGTTEEQARDQVETQVMIEQLVDDEAGPAKPREELRTIYRQAKEQQQHGPAGRRAAEDPVVRRREAAARGAGGEPSASAPWRSR